MSTLHRDPDGEPYVLVRLRADPQRVRVGVRRVGCLWMVTVESRIGAGLPVRVRHARLKAALWRALCLADGRPRPIPGIDLGLGCAWRHPHGLAGYRAEVDGEGQVAPSSDA